MPFYSIILQTGGKDDKRLDSRLRGNDRLRLNMIRRGKKNILKNSVKTIVIKFLYVVI
jgi:hypothetical protein